MLAKIRTALLLLSLLANTALGLRLEHVQRVAAEAARDAEAAYVTALQRQQERSDQVTREAQVRAQAAERSLRTFRETQAAQGATDPSYAAWAAQELPAGVADRLRSLQ